MYEVIIVFLRSILKSLYYLISVKQNAIDDTYYTIPALPNIVKKSIYSVIVVFIN